MWQAVKLIGQSSDCVKRDTLSPKPSWRFRPNYLQIALTIVLEKQPSYISVSLWTTEMQNLTSYECLNWKQHHTTVTILNTEHAIVMIYYMWHPVVYQWHEQVKSICLNTTVFIRQIVHLPNWTATCFDRKLCHFLALSLLKNTLRKTTYNYIINRRSFFYILLYYSTSRESPSVD